MPYLSPILDVKGVARLLKIAPSKFLEIRERLESNGFPRPLALIDNWSREAIEIWISDRAHDGTTWGCFLASIERGRE
ncbi:MAG: hypothetical protein IPK78_03280 [Rhodospirillales bacterium]|nr:hypothetical protein [Rhodospirillales bacterium]